ncbi:hypothetical protein OVA11_19415 [Caulobacter sp. SL161]|uniref:hypothetical protein n=1 Tax=Caulobacter sp. SL161 TaxID=2995156 RepID=UPI002272716D|nr:hypothetical protein [Caulobacter sp. SL161]MCY1649147.1 hypothetical protein [Caulobacter sp. SL161]
MSTYQEDRRIFSRFIDEPDEFKILWSDFEQLRQAHAAGTLDVLTIGLGLRTVEPGRPRQPAIVLQVESLATAKTPLTSASGFPLFVEEVGKIVASPVPQSQDKGSAFTSHYDKPPGGVSIAPLSTNYAGTLGCFVTCQGKTYLLSNRHVLDPALNGMTGGPGVQQQAFYDGNTTNQTMATTTFLAPLSADDPADNVDAAMAQVPGAYDPRILTDQGGENNFAALLAPNTVVAPGDTVTKSGRTTGKTSQEVDLVSAQSRTRYGNGMTYLFKDCISIKNTSPVAFAGGDSGSLLTNAAYQPVGLLFSGNSAKGVAYASKIATVLAALENVAGGPVEIIVGAGASPVHALEIPPQPLELVD